ncbi:uncharacterized protein LY79DRAFT_657326 [Colletotrichum navitas]|uniref:Uncharacterized protein n=1 Tax=Colletotrichum navitas TaxID=681940 RepID=A0AAD8Q8F6_9PEZI|nr:uncharacterized protein LY79DRAFT_657326 [Colletotrichum navitas]KAK1596474.1 hypothetical protein LY79DRAFT_657326 [Colletotrichum navitas]
MFQTKDIVISRQVLGSTAEYFRDGNDGQVVLLGLLRSCSDGLKLRINISLSYLSRFFKMSTVNAEPEALLALTPRSPMTSFAWSDSRNDGNVNTLNVVVAASDLGGIASTELWRPNERGFADHNEVWERNKVSDAKLTQLVNCARVDVVAKRLAHSSVGLFVNHLRIQRASIGVIQKGQH